MQGRGLALCCRLNEYKWTSHIRKAVKPVYECGKSIYTWLGCRNSGSSQILIDIRSIFNVRFPERLLSGNSIEIPLSNMAHAKRKETPASLSPV